MKWDLLQVAKQFKTTRVYDFIFFECLILAGFDVSSCLGFISSVCEREIRTNILTLCNDGEGCSGDESRFVRLHFKFV